MGLPYCTAGSYLAERPKQCGVQNSEVTVSEVFSIPHPHGIYTGSGKQYGTASWSP